MVHFVNCETPAKERYKISHKRTRNKVERSIAALKSRFRCLCKESGGSTMFDETSACEIIVSCIVLHNYCMNRNFPRTVATDVGGNFKGRKGMAGVGIPGAEGHTLS